MNTMVSKIVVLNGYCREGQPFTANLGETYRAFDKTVVAARQRVLALGHRHDEDNFFIEWWPRKPYVLRAIEDGFTSSTQFELELVIEGELADTMLADFMALAEARMAEDIRRENEAKLHEQARQRIQEMLLTVDKFVADFQD